MEKEFIFNFKATPIVGEAIGNRYSGQKVIKAQTAKGALEKARKEFKTNEQFRFEYRLILINP